ncbi:hypothetical protein EVB91_176 [Rhizobium phage RHph_I1_18]|nr:hypothetical protein EVB91_176 [Rhizobium phage RHph_I1_18]
MADKQSTYDRYRLAATQLEHLVDFMRRDNHLVDVIILNGKQYRLTKLQDGSTNIEEITNG